MIRFAGRFTARKSAALAFAMAMALSKGPASADEAVPLLTAFQNVKFSGLVQAWYAADETLKTGGNFRVRRAELGFKGDVVPRVGWFLMIDPTVAGTLKDAAIIFRDEERLPGLSLQAGQFKIPFGMEGTGSSGKIDTVERPMLSSVLKWSDQRDRGVMGVGRYKPGDAAAFAAYLGAFNGEGPNANDVNNDKDIVGRVTADLPYGLHVGGSFHRGVNGPATQLYEHYGAEFALEPPGCPLLLKAETYSGHQGAGSFIWSYYALAGYTLFQKLQPVVRWDVWGVNGPTSNTLFTSAAADYQKELTFGLNYFIKGHNAKLQTSYAFHTQDTVNGAGDAGGTTRGIFRLASQVMF